MKLTAINSHVWWQYTEVCNNPMDLLQIRTECSIESASGVIKTAQATTYSGDSFSKEAGRKLTLKRCIVHIPREIRREIWNEYHSRSGTHKYPPKEKKGNTVNA